MRVLHKPDTKEKEEIAGALFQEVELRSKSSEPLPNRFNLMKLANSTFEISLKESLVCALMMEEIYTKKLAKLGYSPK